MGLLDFFKRGKVEDGGVVIENNERVVNESVVTPVDNADFQFKIEDVFTISGRGVVVVGTVLSGTIRLNEVVRLPDGKCVVVLGIEMFRKTLDHATVGDNAGLLLSDITRNDVTRDMILTK